MNKKGFMFVETIMVITILTSSLIMIYVSFSRVLTNEKRRVAFDDTAYIYRTYYIESYLVSLNLDQYIEQNLEKNNSKIIVFNAEDSSLYNLYNDDGSRNEQEFARQQFSNKIFNSSDTGISILNVSRMYITYYNVNDLKACTNKSGKVTCDSSSVADLNNMSTNAILYLRTLSGTDSGYRLIVEYFENIEGSTKKKYYYNSVKLITRGTYE